MHERAGGQATTLTGLFLIDNLKEYEDDDSINCRW